MLRLQLLWAAFLGGTQILELSPNSAEAILGLSTRLCQSVSGQNAHMDIDVLIPF